jgi:tetratricopeptide (TPR) repeat protein
MMRIHLACLVLLSAVACGPSEATVDPALCGRGRGEPEEEIRACDEMRRLFGEGNQGDSAVLSWRAQARERAGDAAGALADFNAALAIRPDLPGALLGRGRLLLEAGEFEAAQQTLQRSIELHDSVIARDLLGGQALLRGNHQAALEYYGAILEREGSDPMDVVGYYGRGVARLRSGDEQGREDIARAEELNPRVTEGFVERGINP